MTTLAVVGAAVFGLVVGSFLNVVIWRVPRGESIVRPRSACPRCGTPIAPRDEVPVLSWLALRGRCRSCGERISARYPAVELLTAVLFALVVIRFGVDEPERESWRVVPAYLYLVSVGLALALIDFDTKRLPNVITLPSYPVIGVLLGGAALTGAGSRPFIAAFVGAVAMFAVYFALWFAIPGGMGFGDVKLAGVLGACLGWLGWQIWFVGLIAGWISGGVVGIALMALGRAGRKTRVPFGPFMVLGTLFAVFAGEPLARAWLQR